MFRAVKTAEAQTAPLPEVVKVVDLGPPVPIVNPIVDMKAATVYYLRTLPPRTLMEELMGPGSSSKMNYIIQRESGWNCGSNNRHSSAAGLGQTIKNQARVDFLAGHELGPFLWSDVRGPDCLADMILIKQLYDSCGLGPWTPPSYGCRKPG